MNKILFAVAFLFTLSASAQKSNKRELRGAWVTTYLGLDWPVRTQTPAQQRTALEGILDHHKSTGINTIFFQVRSQSDAMYPSDLEPWSYDLNGTSGVAPNPLWDPLQFALDESRKRNFEFHAWINPFRAVANINNAPNTNMYSASHISKLHPEWMLTVGNVQIINPGIPEARQHIINVIVDIVKRYDIDGIHFDDYFYPTGTINDNAAYTADPRGFPNTTAGIADWRRDNLNLFIKTVNDSIASLKPWVKFGVSPTGIYRSSTDPAIGSPTSAGALQHYSAYFADTRKWIQQGWVDYIAPQLYWYIGQTGSDYGVLVPWWNNQASGRHIYIGMAPYKVNDPAQNAAWSNPSQIPDQVRMNRNNAYQNVLGSIYFRSAHMLGNALGFRDSLRQDFYARPALQPRMSWKDDVAPQPASVLQATLNLTSGVDLSWTKTPAAANEMDKAKYYAVYRSGTSTIDIENPLNLIAVVGDTNEYRDQSITPGQTYYYTVTALDRLHNESAATTPAGVNIATSVPQLPEVSNEILIEVAPNPTPDYFQVRIGESGSGQVEYIVMNSLGQVMESRRVNAGTTVLVGSDYTQGFYILRAFQGKKSGEVKLVKSGKR